MKRAFFLQNYKKGGNKARPPNSKTDMDLSGFIVFFS